MIKSKVNNKINATAPSPITKSKPIKKNAKVQSGSLDGGSVSNISSRVEQLALPPIRTLMQNQEQYKHILPERGAGALEQKIKQTMFSRYGRAQDPYAPDLIIESAPFTKSVNKVPINKKPIIAKTISEGLKTPIAPSRIEILSKPLKRRLPTAMSDSPEREICHVKPSTLHYVANERILELAQPKKVPHNRATKKRTTSRR